MDFIRSCYQAEAAAPVKDDRAEFMHDIVRDLYDQEMQLLAQKKIADVSSVVELNEAYVYHLARCRSEYVEFLNLSKNETSACGHPPEGEYTTWNLHPRTKLCMFQRHERILAILRLQAKLRHNESSTRSVDMDVYRQLASKLQEMAAKLPDQDPVVTLT